MSQTFETVGRKFETSQLFLEMSQTFETVGRKFETSQLFLEMSQTFETVVNHSAVVEWMAEAEATLTSLPCRWMRGVLRRRTSVCLGRLGMASTVS